MAIVGEERMRPRICKIAVASLPEHPETPANEILNPYPLNRDAQRQLPVALVITLVSGSPIKTNQPVQTNDGRSSHEEFADWVSDNECSPPPVRGDGNSRAI